MYVDFQAWCLLSNLSEVLWQTQSLLKIDSVIDVFSLYLRVVSSFHNHLLPPNSAIFDTLHAKRNETEYREFSFEMKKVTFRKYDSYFAKLPKYALIWNFSIKFLGLKKVLTLRGFSCKISDKTAILSCIGIKLDYINQYFWKSFEKIIRA